MISELKKLVAERGPIPSVRVSSAQARGRAKNFPYWGAARYEIRLTTKGELSNCPLERASSDRRSRRLADLDAINIANQEGRVLCHPIGPVSESTARFILDQIESGEKEYERPWYEN